MQHETEFTPAAAVSAIDNPVHGVFTAGVRCTVKKWDTPFRRGFLTSPEFDADIYVDVRAMNHMDAAGLCHGQIVIATVGRNYRGLYAETIDLAAPEMVAEVGAFRPAAVKWYSPEKGYGFARVWGENREAFFHETALLRAGMSQIATGTAMAVRLYDTADGKLAINEIAPWPLVCRADLNVWK